MARQHAKLFALCFLIGSTSPAAWASAETPRIGVRVFGAPAKVATPLAQALRDAIIAEGAELVSPDTLRLAEQKLGIEKAARESEASVLRGAAEANASHLLVVRLARDGRRFRAKIEFFVVESGTLRSKGSLRWDRSKASAKRLAGPLIAALIKQTQSSEEPTPTPEAEVETPPAATATVGAAPPIEPEPEPEPELERAEPTTQVEPEPEPQFESAPAVVATPAAEPRPTPERFRAVLRGGSRVLRQYQLDTGAGAESGLSHDLVPSVLFGAELELRWPWPILGLAVSGTFSPVRYQVTVDGALREEPAGFLLDASPELRLHLSLSDQMSLIPVLGVRILISHVDDHRGNFIVSQSAFAPEAGLAFRWNLASALELTTTASGGYVVSFRESPASSGAAGPGVLAAADLGARWWFDGSFGVSFDARLDLLHLSFDGPANRQAPAGEALLDASLTTIDLGLQFGVAIRI